MCLSLIMIICLSNTYATFEVQFMKKLSNTEAKLKRSVAWKKACIPLFAFCKCLCVNFKLALNGVSTSNKTTEIFLEVLQAGQWLYAVGQSVN